MNLQREAPSYINLPKEW